MTTSFRLYVCVKSLQDNNLWLWYNRVMPHFSSPGAKRLELEQQLRQLLARIKGIDDDIAVLQAQRSAVAALIMKTKEDLDKVHQGEVQGELF